MTMSAAIDFMRLGGANWIATFRNAVAITLSIFSIYSAFFGVFSDMLQRSFHLALVVFLIYSASFIEWRQISLRKFLLDLLLMTVGFGVLIYHVLFFDAVASRWGELTETEFWLGVLCIITLLEATRLAGPL